MFKEFRLKLEINQEAMSLIMGVSVHTYAKWERGERNPSKAAIKLLDVLKYLYDNERSIFWDLIAYS